MSFNSPVSWIRLYESIIYAKLTQNYGKSNEVTRERLILDKPLAVNLFLKITN